MGDRKIVMGFAGPGVLLATGRLYGQLKCCISWMVRGRSYVVQGYVQLTAMVCDMLADEAG